MGGNKGVAAGGVYHHPVHIVMRVPFRDGEVDEGGAIHERPRGDMCHRRGNDNVVQMLVVHKGPVADAFKAFGERHAGDVLAIGESVGGQVTCALRQRDDSAFGHQAFHKCRGILTEQHLVHRHKVGVVLVHIDGVQVECRKCQCFNVRHRSRNIDGRWTVGEKKTTIFYPRDRRGDGDARKRGLGERFFAQGNNIVSLAVVCHRSRNVDVALVRATRLLDSHLHRVVFYRKNLVTYSS